MDTFSLAGTSMASSNTRTSYVVRAIVLPHSFTIVDARGSHSPHYNYVMVSRDRPSDSLPGRCALRRRPWGRGDLRIRQLQLRVRPGERSVDHLSNAPPGLSLLNISSSLVPLPASFCSRAAFRRPPWAPPPRASVPAVAHLPSKFSRRGVFLDSTCIYSVTN